MSERIDTAAERARLDAWVAQSRIDGILDRMSSEDMRQTIGQARLMMDEIDRLTAALAEAEDRGAAQMRERAAASLDAGLFASNSCYWITQSAIRALPLREPGGA